MDTVLCSWARQFTLTVPLSTQEYKWVLVICWGNLTNCWGVTCDGLASRPRGVEILLAASCYGNRDKLRSDEPVGSIRLHFFFIGKRSGLISALDSGSSSPGSSPCGDLVFCSWERHFTLTVPLFTRLYKWVPVNEMLGVTFEGLASHPGGSRNTPSRLMLQKPG